MSGPFKMKGSPMKRNFGISPVKGRIRGLSESAQNHNRAHDKHDEGKGPDPHAKEKLPKAI